jgi:tRNA nucleotidyltransferase (CCA-adding enzyme)
MLEIGKGDALRARKLLAKHGDELAFDLVDHKDADLQGKPNPERELEELARFRRVLEREQSSPHRLSDLAVNGRDLMEVGYQPGPALGSALDRLLREVVGDPSLNRRDWLLAKAKELLA